MRSLLFTVVVILIAAPLVAQSPQDLNFLVGLSDGRDLRSMLGSHLDRKAERLFAERRARIAQISTAADVAARKLVLREQMQQALGGPFPERTPLNARVTGVVERADYRIEKVVFESQPKFFVTANLYLPKRGRPPYPAILFPLGHESGAKANDVWQHLLVTFARKGFVALAWDPAGQGERVQLYDPDFENSKLTASTTEHTMHGIQCLLVGDNFARYTIYDGVRALDYLLSRQEVDPKRVGLTGNSGGGTHTAYIAALDDRIQVAAPSCFITSWERLLATIGPQDAEQCLPPWIGAGLDHPDFIHAFAPKPYLVLSAIRDFFPIYGARSSFQEAKRVYERLGAAEKINMVEADDGHGYSKPRREASYRWFTRWLQGAEDRSGEPDVAIASPEELQCTETGQLATSLGGETVHSLNLKRFEELRRNAKPATADEVRRMVGFQIPEGPLNVQPFGRMSGTGYRVERLVYESEPGIRVPSLLYIPDWPIGPKPAAVYLDGRGKALAHGEVESLMRLGLVVLTIDARGIGESRYTADEGGAGWPRYFGDYDAAMTALLLGKPLVAMRAEDVSRAVGLLVARKEVNAGRISAIGRGMGAVPVLYAASFDSRITGVALEEMLVSYESVIRGRLHRGIFENVVRGALRRYDLPDLARWIAPRQVIVVDAVDPLGQPIPLGGVKRQYPKAVRRMPADTAASLYAELVGK